MYLTFYSYKDILTVTELHNKIKDSVMTTSEDGIYLITKEKVGELSEEIIYF